MPPPERVSQSPQPDSAGPAQRTRTPHTVSTAPIPAGDFVQFRLAIGRNNRADPKWIVPLLCRLGNITKQDIGAIRIFETDTRIEIDRDVSEAFAAATADLPRHEPRITQAGDGPMPPRQYRPKPSGAQTRKRRG